MLLYFFTISILVFIVKIFILNMMISWIAFLFNSFFLCLILLSYSIQLLVNYSLILSRISEYFYKLYDMHCCILCFVIKNQINNLIKINYGKYKFIPKKKEFINKIHKFRWESNHFLPDSIIRFWIISSNMKYRIDHFFNRYPPLIPTTAHINSHLKMIKKNKNN